jgi:hypothetical protein
MTRGHSFRTSIEIGTERAVRNRYESIPFEVPVGTALIELSYKVEGDARVDIGLFEGDSNSSMPEISAFRGWSGSDRKVILAGQSVATPGYACSPIKAGRWNVVLGFPKVRSRARVEIEVEMTPHGRDLETTEGPVLRGGKPVLPTDLEVARETVRTIAGVPIAAQLPGHRLGLLCGDFHTHSWHSGDAETPVVEMVAAAEARHMDFLAITDHNTVTHWTEIDAIQPHTGVTLIKGQEVTTYYGHFNAFGAAGIVEFRIEDADDLSQSIRSSNDEGVLFSINHPKHIGPPWKLPYDSGFEAMEAWQAPWVWFNNESLNRWDGLLRSGRKITGIGGSDVHDLRAIPAHQYGCPATWVYLDNSKTPQAIVEAVRRGAVAVTATPDSPIIVLEARPTTRSPAGWTPAMGKQLSEKTPLRLRAIGSTGRLVARVIGKNGRVDEWVVGRGDSEWEIADPSVFGSWLRAELWGRGMYLSGPLGGSNVALVSMTNPVFISD